jgi:hypothetical protein
MSSLQINTSIALVINDHNPHFGDGVSEEIECLCGEVFPYHSRWSMHVAQEIVDKILGGDL